MNKRLFIVTLSNGAKWEMQQAIIIVKAISKEYIEKNINNILINQNNDDIRFLVSYRVTSITEINSKDIVTLVAEGFEE